MILTDTQLARIRELLVDRPQCRLVWSEDEFGSGYTIEFDGGVIHPLAFLDLIDGGIFEPIDILKAGQND
jgi:hypothetical protein